MSRRGLIVGKFYPPHRGHRYLIESALAQVDELHVIICERPCEEPSGSLRASWLREIHPDVRVLLIEDRLDPDDSRAWAEHSIRWLGFVPDVAFTSEDYGERFAHFMGCEHVLVDRARAAVPVSGTDVRANPFSCWEFIDPPVRAYYARRVCLLGAESTGKTTLTERLARHYRTVWVPEYGREVAERKLAEEGGYNWRSEEFVEIAQEQAAREEAAARQANRVLFCDTDAFATGIWHERYMGTRSPEVETVAKHARRPDLYLVTGVDAPFIQDGTRDGEAIRSWMHAAFLEALAADGRPHRVLSGSWDERFDAAVHCVDVVLAERVSRRGL